MTLRLSSDHIEPFVSNDEVLTWQEKVNDAHEKLHNKTGLGNDFLGWMSLPTDYDKDEFDKIKETAKKIIKDTDVFIVIGIGGSYLGARAAIEFVSSPLYNNKRKNTPDIYFAGNSLSSSSLSELLELCEGRRVSINVISKSGTTTEPAVAFRVFRDFLMRSVGNEEAKKRIYVTTDKKNGVLKTLADAEGYQSFVVPDDIGGRFSVLTAVGLLPIAVAGCDIDNLMLGAKDAQNELANKNIAENDAYKYAVMRNILYNRGKSVELMVSYNPKYAMMAEWWKQLFGESEGKDGKGIFPAAAVFSTDLHSLGQYIQDGREILFETVLFTEKERKEITIQQNENNDDGLNFLAGKTVSYLNKKAFEGTVLAHTDGNIPCIVLSTPDFSEHTLGYLIYFFEKACALSGYLLGVNPFDQPGVEAYKKNMFALIGKQGFEKEKTILEQRLYKK